MIGVRRHAGSGTRKDFPLSNADYLDIRQQAHAAFEGFAARQTFRGTLPPTDGGPPDPVTGAVVSSNFFRLMGGSIVIGRDFAESDDSLQPAAPGNSPPGTPAPALLPRYVVPQLRVLAVKRFSSDHSIFGRLLARSATCAEWTRSGRRRYSAFRTAVSTRPQSGSVARFLGVRAHPLRYGQPQQRAVARDR